MALNIKNEEAHRLAAQLSKLTGESMSEAVTKAVREKIDRIKAERRGDLAERLMEIGRQCAGRMKEPFKSIDHADLLYDEKGLPK